MSVASVTMQVIDLSALRPGAILPTPIYDAYNPALLLLGAGTRLNDQILARLEKRGVTRVIVDSEHANEIAPGSVAPKKDEPKIQKITAADIRKAGNHPLNKWLREPKPHPPTPELARRFQQMREMQEQELQETLAQVSRGIYNKTGKLKSLSVDSCEMMLEDLDLYVKLAINHRGDSAGYSHSLRTAQLAMAIAAVLGKSCENISDLGVGCLISRAGQTEYARQLAQAERPLTENEWLEIQKIPNRTFDLMEKCLDVPVGARQVAYQMFERWDGSGYPRGRTGTQIHPLSRIAAVADVYVALTSSRPHRPPYSPYQAIEIILADTRKGLYDPQTVRGLLQTVCLYPVGSRVRLSDESQATVLRTKPKAYDRPIVQITHGPDGCSQDPVTVDLSEQEAIAIVEVIEEVPCDDRQLKLGFEEPES